MKFYLSHTIRGKHGDKATYTQMKANCDRAIAIANLIRSDLPSIELYVPGEHEFPPVGYFIRKGYITAEQALEIDCMVIDECDGVIVFCPPDAPLQGGREVEYKYAVQNNKPVCIFARVSEINKWLAQQIIKA